MNKKKGLIKGPFVLHRSEMYKSPAWRSIRSLAVRQILDCLEIEHMHHAGERNGELICTYDQFVAYGIRRKSIAPGIRLGITIGVLKITRQGRRVAGYHIPTMYALTYLPIGNTPPTDEWRNYLPNTVRPCDFDAAKPQCKRHKPQCKTHNRRGRKRYPQPGAGTPLGAGGGNATAAAGGGNATPFYNSIHLPASESELVEEEQDSESLKACTEFPAAPIENGKLPECNTHRLHVGDQFMHPRRFGTADNGRWRLSGKTGQIANGTEIIEIVELDGQYVRFHRWIINPDGAELPQPNRNNVITRLRADLDTTGFKLCNASDELSAVK